MAADPHNPQPDQSPESVSEIILSHWNRLRFYLRRHGMKGRWTWTAEHRRRYARRGLRYPSDLTDAEWALIEPLIAPAKRGRRRRVVDLRALVHPASVQDRAGIAWLLDRRTRRRFPFLEVLFADQGHQGP